MTIYFQRADKHSRLVSARTVQSEIWRLWNTGLTILCW